MINVRDFRPSYEMYADEIKIETQKVIDSGRVLEGPMVEACEDQLRRLTGKEYAVMYSSATTAIEALLSLSDEDIITPSVNFVSVPVVADKLERAVEYAPRVRPLYGAMDSDYDTDLYDYWHVALAGQATDDYVASVKPHHFEDASQCFMTMTSAGMIGSFGKAGVYSFTFNKFATAGEGGVVVTDDPAIFEAVTRYKNHGRLAGEKRVDQAVGYNYRMSELNAAFLLPQLKNAERTLAHMKDQYGRYVTALELHNANGYVYGGQYNNYSRFIVRTKRREFVRQRLLDDWGIQTPTPILDFDYGGIGENGWDEMLCLPFHHAMPMSEMEYVGKALAAVLELVNQKEA